MRDTPRQREHTARVVRCVECGCSSGLRWRGWGAYRYEDAETTDPPVIVFYCPSCAENEFGHSRRV
jgi:hypothetical protein